MAVSMSAGFMRSDYMISDAALPLRMEELEELEQSAKFSEILSSIGNYEPTSRETKATKDVQPTEEGYSEAPKADIPTEEAVTVDVPKETPKALSKAELKALARAVVKGDIRLTDIPEEMRSEVLLSVIAMMMAGVPEDEIPELMENYEEGAEVITEPVEAILTDKRPTDKSGELQELIHVLQLSLRVFNFLIDILQGFRQACGIAVNGDGQAFDSASCHRAAPPSSLKCIEILLTGELPVGILTFIVPAFRIQIVDHSDGQKVQIPDGQADLYAAEQEQCRRHWALSCAKFFLVVTSVWTFRPQSSMI